MVSLLAKYFPLFAVLYNLIPALLNTKRFESVKSSNGEVDNKFKLAYWGSAIYMLVFWTPMLIGMYQRCSIFSCGALIIHILFPIGLPLPSLVLSDLSGLCSLMVLNSLLTITYHCRLLANLSENRYLYHQV